MTPWMMIMMTIISALTISLFLVQQDCPFIATLGGKADICERKLINKLKKIKIQSQLSNIKCY